MARKKKAYKIDELDLSILSILLFNAKKPYAEIGKQLKVSGGTVHVRIKKLMDSGIVNGSNLDVNYDMLGYSVTAYLGVFLEKSSYYSGMVEELKKVPEVVEAHYTTGSYSALVKIMCKDMKHLRKVLSEKIQSVQGVSRTETFLSLDAGISRPVNLDEVEA